MTSAPANNQNSTPNADQNQIPGSPTANQSTPPPGVDPQAWEKYQQELAIYHQQMAVYQQQMAQQVAKSGSVPPPPPGDSASVSASPTTGVSGQPTPVPSASLQPASVSVLSAQPTPVPGASSQPTPVVKRPRGRRRPRFVEKPKKQNDQIVSRRNLLSATKAPDGKHQFSRERKIAGDLPDWNPLPPGEIRVTRRSS